MCEREGVRERERERMREREREREKEKERQREIGSTTFNNENVPPDSSRVPPGNPRIYDKYVETAQSCTRHHI